MTMPQLQRLMQNSHLLHENQFGENSTEANAVFEKEVRLLLGCIKYLQQNAFTDLPLRSPNKILSYCSSSAFCLVAQWY